MITRLPRPGRSWLQALLIAGACGVASGTSVIGLKVTPAAAQCGELLAPAVPEPLAAARARVPDSQVVRGSRDIQWAWLGSPTPRYPHTALGSPVHAGSLHVLARAASGAPREVVHHLPLHRVFEDRVPRLVDLDRDGHDDIIVVESDLIRGAAVVVYGLRASTLPGGQAELAEIARSPHAGSPFRWLNPVGVADFDGDGQADIASVTTPHIGGVLTLYHFRPPRLEPFARAMDVSNHRMGDLEQQLALIVETPGQRPTVLIPDMTHRTLHALRWETPGQWQEATHDQPLPARVTRMTPAPGGACLRLADASWWRATLVTP